MSHSRHSYSECLGNVLKWTQIETLILQNLSSEILLISSMKLQSLLLMWLLMWGCSFLPVWARCRTTLRYCWMTSPCFLRIVSSGFRIRQLDLEVGRNYHQMKLLFDLLDMAVLRFHFSDSLGMLHVGPRLRVQLHDKSASPCFLGIVSCGFRVRPTHLEMAETNIVFS